MTPLPSVMIVILSFFSFFVECAKTIRIEREREIMRWGKRGNRRPLFATVCICVYDEKSPIDVESNQRFDVYSWMINRILLGSSAEPSVLWLRIVFVSSIVCVCLFRVWSCVHSCLLTFISVLRRQCWNCTRFYYTSWFYRHLKSISTIYSIFVVFVVIVDTPYILYCVFFRLIYIPNKSVY